MKDAAMTGALLEGFIEAVSRNEIGPKPHNPKFGNGVLIVQCEQGEECRHDAEHAEKHARRNRPFKVDVRQDTPIVPASVRVRR